MYWFIIKVGEKNGDEKREVRVFYWSNGGGIVVIMEKGVVLGVDYCGSIVVVVRRNEKVLVNWIVILIVEF